MTTSNRPARSVSCGARRLSQATQNDIRRTIMPRVNVQVFEGVLRPRKFVRSLIVIVMALACRAAPAQDPLLWGGLKPGPHAVGFRSLYRLDHTRQYDPDFVSDPAQPQVPKPRPIYIAVWYPAKKSDAKPMEYREYLDASSSDPAIAPFAERLSRHWVAVVSEETVGKEPAYRTPAETAAFDRLMGTRTFAVKDAAPADGQFPVVL